MLVRGEAGIGRTRLGEELVGALSRRGAVPLVARAYEDESALAYGPVIDLLTARLAVSPGVLDGLPDPTRHDVGRLLGDVAYPAVDGLPRPGEEARFLASLWDALVAACAGGRAGGPRRSMTRTSRTRRPSPFSPSGSDGRRGGPCSRC